MAFVDIFVFARARMDNKGFAMRIKNSGRFHALRSAMSSKGSALSKLGSVAGMGVRAAFKLIPVPIVGDLLGAAQKAVEGKVRKSRHASNYNSATSTADKVKFQLKDLSVEELDRFRWKLAEAVGALNQQASKYNGLVATKISEHRPCDAYLAMAEAIAQAERRHYKLDHLAGTLIAALQLCQTWCNDQKKEIEKFHADFQKVFTKSVKNDKEEVEAMARKICGTNVGDVPKVADQLMAARHEKCEAYCYHKQVAESDNWAETRQRIAEFVREASEPFELESFLSFDGEPYKVSDS